MNKKIRALIEEIKAKNEQAKSFLDGESKNIEKANALFDEIEILKSELEAEKKALENDKIAAGQKFDEHKSEKGKGTNSTEKFANDIKLLATKKLSEGVNDDGGYTVPEDIQTKINQYKTADFSFEDYIDKETVTTPKGSRIYQKKTDVTGFSKVDEGSDFAEIAEPKFEKQTFEITDKGGVLAVTNSLLRDTAENIENVIVEWFAKTDVQLSIMMFSLFLQQKQRQISLMLSKVLRKQLTLLSALRMQTQVKYTLTTTV